MHRWQSAAIRVRGMSLKNFIRASFGMLLIAAISASEGQSQQVVLVLEGQLQVDMIAWKYASVGGLKCIN
jgi:hypothetical protein